ncbi:MAG: DNA mismatch repair protein MutS [Thermotogae bacterium]|jgi:DNA mismatch repair ATPase MutS|nr:DNA mismatch repair protein MutS [Thermotogota bacterium]
MKVFLMFRNRDFDLEQQLPPFADDLVQDLELNIILNAMSNGDEFVFNISKRALLSSINSAEMLLYRQNIIKDCLKNPSTVRNLYSIAIEGIEQEKKTYFGFFSKYPDAILHSAMELLHLFISTLRKLRKIVDDESSKFESEGFKRFFKMIQTELTDEYFEMIEEHLKYLEFKSGMLIGVNLGTGNKGENYMILKPNEKKEGFLDHIFSKKEESYTFVINDRDERGAEALGQIKDKATNSVANAIAQSADHILNFFKIMRVELAFYVGSLNLYDQITKIGEPICFPDVKPSDDRIHDFEDLYDISLALVKKEKVIGNEINAEGKALIMITGANQGGKSTFLRSIGIAQLMMQAGLFVPAQRFSANISNGIFTHYKREEDKKMDSGKFDEELKRMDKIVNYLKSDSMVLFNESFSATNEREGSEIARQIISALIEKNIKVFFVTHMYELAHEFYKNKSDDFLFLRAERSENGNRTFKILNGEPLQTSYGVDLYKKIFADQRSSIEV